MFKVLRMTVANNGNKRMGQSTIQDFLNLKKKQKSSPSEIVTKLESISTNTITKPKDETISKEIKHGKFKDDFIKALNPKERELLSLEIDTMEDSWFEKLSGELTKPYFLQLKEFLKNEIEVKKATIFPPPEDIYSWSRLTPFESVKVVIIGQDPYHNFNQAHGLAFSVKKPTPAPPSLKNIYKELKNNYSDFVVDNKQGDLINWAKQGVLLLNTALTVRAHNANSHAKCGWDQFTKRIVEVLIQEREKSGENLIFMLWGNNAINLVQNILKKNKPANDNILILKSVHPSPLSASRGFYNNMHFREINKWLYEKHHEKMIDWSVVPGATIKEVVDNNSKL